MTTKKLKICLKGHQFYKSSDCPVCPICDRAVQPTTGFLSLISTPARRALLSKNITNLNTLATFTQDEILSLHGIGPSAIPKLKQALVEIGLDFKP